jgi:NAD+ synthase
VTEKQKNKKILSHIVSFIGKETRKRGFKRIVLGISGGVDSAVAAYLCCKALGPKNVLGLIMPYRTNKRSDIKDAGDIVKILGMRGKLIDITPAVDHYFVNIKGIKNTGNKKIKIRMGNKMARERMSIIYDHTKEFGALACGTGNKTEILLGYFTRHGDAACDINPLGGIYKTQVWGLAKFMGVPERIIKKAPSAGLWPGQTDESEIGYSYKDIDRLLYYLVEKKYNDARLGQFGFKPGFVRDIKRKIKENEFKLKPPAVCPSCGK